MATSLSLPWSIYEIIEYINITKILNIFILGWTTVSSYKRKYWKGPNWPGEGEGEVGTWKGKVGNGKEQFDIRAEALAWREGEARESKGELEANTRAGDEAVGGRERENGKGDQDKAWAWGEEGVGWFENEASWSWRGKDQGEGQGKGGREKTCRRGVKGIRDKKGDDNKSNW